MNGVETRYVYDGETVVEGVSGSNSALLYRLAGVGFVKGGVQYYDQENLQGSSVLVLDMGGNPVSYADYDSYGLTYHSSGFVTDFRWTGGKGYVTDDDTGMDLLGSRYYLPATGRFLTQDPIGHGGGMNLYAYCDDNPLTRFDPTGHRGDEKYWESGFRDPLHYGIFTSDLPTDYPYQFGSTSR